MSVVRIYSSFDNPIEVENGWVDNKINCNYGVSLLESATNPFRQTCYCILPKGHKGQHKIALGHDGGETTFLMRKHFEMIKKR